MSTLDNDNKSLIKKRVAKRRRRVKRSAYRKNGKEPKEQDEDSQNRNDDQDSTNIKRPRTNYSRKKSLLSVPERMKKDDKLLENLRRASIDRLGRSTLAISPAQSPVKPRTRSRKKKLPRILPSGKIPLRDLSLAGVAHHITQGRVRNIIVMTGAGISVSAGIPDFRSPGTGLYHNLSQFNLPEPYSIFDFEFFKQNPKPFFTLAKELYPENFKPTIVHHFIHLLNEKGLLLRNYTQNIDGLERMAKVPEEKLVEAHGTFYTAHCINSKCKKTHNHKEIKDVVFSGDIPRCFECDSLVKPDVVMFGEDLNSKFYDLVEDDFRKCDLLIVLGTSLVVRPFNTILDIVPEDCPRVLINREQSGQKNDPLGIRSPGGFKFDHLDNERDVVFLGDCDDGVACLARWLEWEEELQSCLKEFS